MNDNKDNDDEDDDNDDDDDDDDDDYDDKDRLHYMNKIPNQTLVSMLNGVLKYEEFKI